MPVGPDLLLTNLATAKPRTASPEARQNTAEPRRQDAASFSQVYAKERQAKPIERSDGPPRPSRDNKADSRSSDNSPAPAAKQQPAVADNGKSLPVEQVEDAPTDEDGAAVDPLLMLGLFEPQPVIVPPEGEALTEEVEPELPTLVPDETLVSGVPVAIPTVASEVAFDPEVDVLDQLPAVRLALDMEQQKIAGQASAQSASTANAAGNSQVQATAVAAMGINTMTSSVPTGELDSSKLSALEFTSEGLEALKESSSDTRPEQFVSKLSALSQAIGQQASVAARAPVAPGQPVAMQQAGWSDGVVDKVMWMSSQNLKSAEIQLDPAELGRLDVRISLNQDQTQISFTSAHAGVREALESQVHRLREMLTQQGLNLADVNVSDQSQGRGWQQGQGGGDDRGRGNLHADEGLSSAAEEERISAASEVREPILGAGRSMVDYYA